MKETYGVVVMAVIDVLVECFNNMMDGLYYYYDRRNGEIVEIYIMHLELAHKYLNGDNLSYIEEWERKVVLETVDFLKNIRFYVKLPARYDVDEYRIMARFCYTRKKKKHVNKLMDALSGKGRMRTFNETVKKLRLVEEWKEFRHKELVNIAIKWCEENGIPY